MANDLRLAFVSLVFFQQDGTFIGADGGNLQVDVGHLVVNIGAVNNTSGRTIAIANVVIGIVVRKRRDQTRAAWEPDRLTVAIHVVPVFRSEERRVGKEGRCRWST